MVFGSGGPSPHNYDPYVGLMDDIRFYSAALKYYILFSYLFTSILIRFRYSTAEITTVMNQQGAAPPPPTTTAANPQTPVIQRKNFETFKGLVLQRQAWTARADTVRPI